MARKPQTIFVQIASYRDPELVNKIADETVTTDMETLLPHLEKVSHPALTMEAVM